MSAADVESDAGNLSAEEWRERFRKAGFTEKQIAVWDAACDAHVAPKGRADPERMAVRQASGESPLSPLDLD